MKKNKLKTILKGMFATVAIVTTLSIVNAKEAYASNGVSSASTTTTNDDYNKVIDSLNTGVFDESKFSGIDNISETLVKVYPELNLNIMNKEAMNINNPYTHNISLTSSTDFEAVGTYMYNTIKPITHKLAKGNKQEAKKEYLKFYGECLEFMHMGKPLNGVKLADLNPTERAAILEQIAGMNSSLAAGFYNNNATALYEVKIVYNNDKQEVRIFESESEAKRYAGNNTKDFSTRLATDKDYSYFDDRTKNTISNPYQVSNKVISDYLNCVSKAYTRVYTAEKDLIEVKSMELVSNVNGILTIDVTTATEGFAMQISAAEVKINNNMIEVPNFEYKGKDYKGLTFNRYTPAFHNYAVNTKNSIANTFEGANFKPTSDIVIGPVTVTATKTNGTVEELIMNYNPSTMKYETVFSDGSVLSLTINNKKPDVKFVPTTYKVIDMVNGKYVVEISNGQQMLVTTSEVDENGDVEYTALKDSTGTVVYYQGGHLNGIEKYRTVSNPKLTK